MELSVAVAADLSAEETSVGELSPIQSMVLQSMGTAMILKQLHWLVSGNDFGDTHEYLDDLYSEMLGDVDLWGELATEIDQGVAELITGVAEMFPPDYMIETLPSSGSVPMLGQARFVINSYISTLENSRDTFTPDIQSVLDERIRLWKKHCNYFIAARLGE
jgi:hypothetical protein